MKPSLLRSRLLLGAVSVTALFLSSCIVTDYPSVYTSPGYQPTNTYASVATVPTGLIQTTSSYWYYDPFRRSYYDMRRRAYYNSLSSQYYRTPPTRYSTRRYPSGWNGHGTCPLPRNIYNHSRVSHNAYNQQIDNRPRVQNVNHNTRAYNPNTTLRNYPANHNTRVNTVNHSARVNTVNNNKPGVKPKPKSTTNSKPQRVVHDTSLKQKTQSSKPAQTSSSNNTYVSKRAAQHIANRSNRENSADKRTERWQR